MIESQDFWPHRAVGIFPLLAGLFVVLFCLCGVAVVGPTDPWAIVYFGTGALFAFLVGIGGGGAIMMSRVVVGNQGLAKSFWPIPLHGYKLSWESVEWW